MGPSEGLPQSDAMQEWPKSPKLPKGARGMNIYGIIVIVVILALAITSFIYLEDIVSVIWKRRRGAKK
jgi:hypothetical protein